MCGGSSSWWLSRDQIWAHGHCLFSDEFTYAGKNDGAFIASCDPLTVLALVEAVEAALALVSDDGSVHPRKIAQAHSALAPFRQEQP